MTAVVLSRPKTHTLFKLGDTLIYYHKWKRWEKPKNQTWFHNLSLEECEQLAPDDQVWIDVDPLCHRGKVYGCVLVNITSISGTAKDTLRVGYSSPIISGSSQITYQGKLALLADEERVYAWTKDVDAARNV